MRSILDEPPHVPVKQQSVDKPANETERRIELKVIDHRRSAWRLLEAVFVSKAPEWAALLFVDEEHGSLKLGDPARYLEGDAEVRRSPGHGFAGANQSARDSGHLTLAGIGLGPKMGVDVPSKIEDDFRRSADLDSTFECGHHLERRVGVASDRGAVLSVCLGAGTLLCCWQGHGGLV